MSDDDNTEPIRTIAGWVKVTPQMLNGGQEFSVPTQSSRRQRLCARINKVRRSLARKIMPDDDCDWYDWEDE